MNDLMPRLRALKEKMNEAGHTDEWLVMIDGELSELDALIHDIRQRIWDEQCVRVRHRNSLMSRVPSKRVTVDDLLA